MDEGMQRYYDEKFVNIEKNIIDIKDMVKMMIEKDEEKISMIIELKIKQSKQDDLIIKAQEDINNFFGQFRAHCEEHKGWFSKSVRSILGWIAAISAAVVGLGIITAALIWVFKMLKLV